MAQQWASDYVDVATRVAAFFEKYPEGTVQCAPAEIKTIGDRTFIAVTAAAYRTPDDARPAIAQAWEPFPGRTSFTKDSEAMNAETSAIGRALGLLGLHARKSLATAEEVRNRKAEQEEGKRRTSTSSNGNTVNLHVVAERSDLYKTLAPHIANSKTLDELHAVADLIKANTGTISADELEDLRSMYATRFESLGGAN